MREDVGNAPATTAPLLFTVDGKQVVIKPDDQLYKHLSKLDPERQVWAYRKIDMGVDPVEACEDAVATGAELTKVVRLHSADGKQSGYLPAAASIAQEVLQGIPKEFLKGEQEPIADDVEPYGWYRGLRFAEEVAIAGVTGAPAFLPYRRRSELVRTDTEWLVHGIAQARRAGFFYGDSNSLKSFLMIDMSLHIATGKSWHGQRVEKGLVVYIAGEGEDGMPARVEGWEKQHNNGEPVEDFIVIPMPVLIGEQEWVRSLLRTIQQIEQERGRRVSLIVYDTFSQCSSGDENAAKDTGPMLRAAIGINKAVGSTGLFIHHTGKDASKGMRGSAVLKGNTDAIVKVVRTEENSRETVVVCEKQKDAPQFQPFVFKFDSVHLGVNRYGEDEDTLVITGKREATAEDLGREPERETAASVGQKAIINALEKRGGPTPYKLIRDDVAVVVDSVSHFSRWVTDLTNKKKIYRDGDKLCLDGYAPPEPASKPMDAIDWKPLPDNQKKPNKTVKTILAAIPPMGTTIDMVVTEVKQVDKTLSTPKIAEWIDKAIENGWIVNSNGILKHPDMS